LELSALEADGKERSFQPARGHGEDQVKALIEQGTGFPYQTL
jgi:type IV pilus assembly protein PilQ